MAGEENNGEETNDYEYVTEAYGAVSRSAKVTKHVSRVKVPNTGLVWNEDILVRLEISPISWSHVHLVLGR